MEKKQYGYARVSSKDQKLDRQIDVLMACGLETRISLWKSKAEGIFAAGSMNGWQGG